MESYTTITVTDITSFSQDVFNRGQRQVPTIK